MHDVTYLLLISLGAMFILGIFHFTIYLQQNDKAFRNYAFYLLVMSVFNLVRILDARLTSIYPISRYTLETLDPILSNIGFLMYVNFLGVILNITSQEKFYYKSWKIIQVSIVSFLSLYFILRITGDAYKVSNAVITLASFFCMGLGLMLMLRLFHFIKDTFFKLIVAGTIVSVVGVFLGLAVNVFVLKDNLAFEGLYFLEISMLVETIFLSAALGYRLKMAYRQKEIYQERLLEETIKRELLALQTAQLLKEQLNIKDMQNRISKDLHDDIGSSLSSLQIYSSLAKNLVDEKPGQAKEMLQQMATNSEDIMRNMEDIIWSMQTSTSDTHSIENKIRYFSDDVLMAKEITCKYQFDKETEQICWNIETRKNILLITKEAINNIVKYSNAANVFISLVKENGHVILSIRDDGKGFDKLSSKKGNGLINMSSRALSMGGNTVISSEPGKGTSVITTFPIATISDTPD
ncbi:MAG: sensor histidine kinase [Ferruginibacter sp.]